MTTTNSEKRAELRRLRFEREQRIVALAQATCAQEGQLEIDENARVSEGESNGAFVQAWVWVPFDDTEFDKEKDKS